MERLHLCKRAADRPWQNSMEEVTFKKTNLLTTEALTYDFFLGIIQNIFNECRVIEFPECIYCFFDSILFI